MRRLAGWWRPLQKEALTTMKPVKYPRKTLALAALFLSMAACSSAPSEDSEQGAGAQTAKARCVADWEDCTPLFKQKGCSSGATLPGGGDVVYVGGGCEIGSLCALDIGKEDNGKPNPKYAYYRCVPREQVGILGDDGKTTCFIEGKTARYCGVGK